MQVGATKDQGLYNKASVAVHPGSLAAGTLPQYSTIQKRQAILWGAWTLFTFLKGLSFIELINSLVIRLYIQ